MLLEDMQGVGGAFLQEGVRRSEPDIEQDEPREKNRAPPGQEEAESQAEVGGGVFFTL